MTLISPITAKAATARIVALVVLGAAGILLAVRAAQSRRGASPVEVEVTGTVRLTDGRVAIGAKVGSRLDLDGGSAVPSISVGSVATTDAFGRFTIKTTAARRQVRLAAIDVQGRHVGLAAVDVDPRAKAPTVSKSSAASSNGRPNPESSSTGATS